MSTDTIDPLRNPTDFLDAVIAESEARSPGFGTRVESALEERCRRRAEMLGATPEPDIKAGDVVYLKSVSPPLVVGYINGAFYSVSWFNGAQVQTAQVYAAACTKVNPTRHANIQAQLDAAYAQHNEDLKTIAELELRVTALTPQWKHNRDELPPAGVAVLVVFYTLPSEVWVLNRTTAENIYTKYQWAHIPAAWMP